MKAGRTRAGSRAAGSHTAALAASDVAVDALFQQSGVIRADTIDEMFDVAACLDAQPLPAGRRVAIVTNAGGPGILAVDACEAAGLAVSEFSEATRDTLRAFLPAEASRRQPRRHGGVRRTGRVPADHRHRARRRGRRRADRDLHPGRSAHLRRDPGRHPRRHRRRPARRGHWQAGAGLRHGRIGQPAPLVVDGETVPAYAFPENAARALGKVAAYAQWRATPPALFWGFDDIRPGDARDLCRDVVADRRPTLG